MEKSKNAFLKNCMTYGAITGLAFIIFSVISYMLDLQNNKALQFLNYAIIIAGIILGILNYRNKLNNGSVTYGKGVGIGVLVSIFASIILAFYIFIFFKYIDVTALDKIYELMEQEMLKNPQLGQAEVDTAMEMMKKFTTPTTMAVGIILSYAFWGLIFSLIISIFTKKKGDSFTEAMSEIKDDEPAEKLNN